MFSASSEVPKDEAPERKSATSKNDSTKSFPMFEDAEVVNVALLLFESVVVFFSLETNNLFDDDENDDNDEVARNILSIPMI